MTTLAITVDSLSCPASCLHDHTHLIPCTVYDPSCHNRVYSAPVSRQPCAQVRGLSGRRDLRLQREPRHHSGHPERLRRGQSPGARDLGGQTGSQAGNAYLPCGADRHDARGGCLGRGVSDLELFRRRVPGPRARLVS